MTVPNTACAERATETPDVQPAPADVAERRLRSHPYPALKTISCDWLGGVLVLRGCLPSYYLKQIAQEAVVSLEGVERIDNQIQVVRVAVGGVPPDTVSPGAPETDASCEDSRQGTSPDSDHRTRMGFRITAPYGEEIEVDG